MHVAAQSCYDESGVPHQTSLDNSRRSPPTVTVALHYSFVLSLI